MMSAYLLMMQ